MILSRKVQLIEFLLTFLCDSFSCHHCITCALMATQAIFTARWRRGNDKKSRNTIARKNIACVALEFSSNRGGGCRICSCIHRTVEMNTFAKVLGDFLSRSFIEDCRSKMALTRLNKDFSFKILMLIFKKRKKGFQRSMMMQVLKRWVKELKLKTCFSTQMTRNNCR